MSLQSQRPIHSRWAGVGGKSMLHEVGTTFASLRAVCLQQNFKTCSNMDRLSSGLAPANDEITKVANELSKIDFLNLYWLKLTNVVLNYCQKYFA